MFNGAVTGQLVSLSKPREIVQLWRSNSWPAGYFSRLTYTLTETTQGTRITQQQDGIPDSDYDRTIAGWRQIFWERFQILYGLVRILDKE